MSSTLYALYLSRAARENLEIGLAAETWGLTQDAVARHLGQLPEPQSGLEILERLRPGDQIMAAAGGPQPRVKRGGWAPATLDEGSLWRVTTPYRYDARPLWPRPSGRPAETYPHRFGIEEVERLSGVDRGRIGLVGLDAMHYSANVGGLPVPVLEAPPIVAKLGPPAPGETDDPAFLVLDGELDATALTTVRREQRRLRRKVFGAASSAECALCRRLLPVDCLRVAHIRKRSTCDERQRRALANLMPACTLGCDHLFELGYVYVDERGSIRGNRRRDPAGVLRSPIGPLEGASCAAHTPASEPYFAWHREWARG
jgi:hypothetical protein